MSTRDDNQAAHDWTPPEEPPRLDEARRLLRQQLADIECHWRKQADPVLRQLANIESLTMPRYVVDMARQSLIVMPPGTESVGDRMTRLERERGELLQLLRMIRSTVPLGTLPSFLANQLARSLDELVE